MFLFRAEVFITVKAVFCNTRPCGRRSAVVAVGAVGGRRSDSKNRPPTSVAVTLPGAEAKASSSAHRGPLLTWALRRRMLCIIIVMLFVPEFRNAVCNE